MPAQLLGRPTGVCVFRQPAQSAKGWPQLPSISCRLAPHCSFRRHAPAVLPCSVWVEVAPVGGIALPDGGIACPSGKRSCSDLLVATQLPKSLQANGSETLLITSDNYEAVIVSREGRAAALEHSLAACSSSSGCLHLLYPAAPTTLCPFSKIQTPPLCTPAGGAGHPQGGQHQRQPRGHHRDQARLHRQHHRLLPTDDGGLPGQEAGLRGAQSSSVGDCTGWQRCKEGLAKVSSAARWPHLRPRCTSHTVPCYPLHCLCRWQCTGRTTPSRSSSGPWRSWRRRWTSARRSNPPLCPPRAASPTWRWVNQRAARQGC